MNKPPAPKGFTSEFNIMPDEPFESDSENGEFPEFKVQMGEGAQGPTNNAYKDKLKEYVIEEKKQEEQAKKQKEAQDQVIKESKDKQDLKTNQDRFDQKEKEAREKYNKREHELGRSERLWDKTNVPEGDYDKDLFAKVNSMPEKEKFKKRKFKINLFEFQIKNLMSSEKNLFVAMQLGYDWKIERKLEKGRRFVYEKGGFGTQRVSALVKALDKDMQRPIENLFIEMEKEYTYVDLFYKF